MSIEIVKRTHDGFCAVISPDRRQKQEEEERPENKTVFEQELRLQGGHASTVADWITETLERNARLEGIESDVLDEAFAVLRDHMNNYVTKYISPK